MTEKPEDGAARSRERHRLAVAVVLVSLITVTCGQPDSEAPPERPPAPAALDTASVQDASLRDRAERIVAFLRGDAPPDPELLADSVTLYVAPEGGGDRRRVSKETLQERGAWQVGRRTLLPAGGLTRLTTRVGRHFKCREAMLGSLYPDLARNPHVGVRLEPPRTESCLQTWNMTLVFDGNDAEPRLISAVYDQWEW